MAFLAGTNERLRGSNLGTQVVLDQTLPRLWRVIVLILRVLLFFGFLFLFLFFVFFFFGVALLLAFLVVV